MAFFRPLIIVLVACVAVFGPVLAAGGVGKADRFCEKRTMLVQSDDAYDRASSAGDALVSSCSAAAILPDLVALEVVTSSADIFAVERSGPIAGRVSDIDCPPQGMAASA